MAQDHGPVRSMLLASLSEGERGELMSRARPVRFPVGASIYGRDDPGDTMLVIDSGRVEVSVTALSGRKSVLNHMGPGEALGEIVLFDEGARSADAVAATEVAGRVLHRRDVVAFMRDHPEAMLGLVKELCDKVRNASEMFTAQAETDASARLARCLLRLADKWGEEDGEGLRQVPQEFSQSDLGEFAGLSRENVNRRLRAWAEEGLIRLGGDGVTLLDEDGLAEIAQV